MKKKKFLAFTLCSLLTLTSIQEPLAFSDETPDDPAFSDEITSDETAYDTGISDVSASGNSSVAPDFSSGGSDDPNISSDKGSFQATPARKPSENSIPITADSGFADSVFRKWISEKLDTDHDGLLSDEEISVCTKITIPSMSVDSLEGIEYFYNLETLDCSGNELLFLDVSANTVLKSLNCSHNNLLSLDLSSCKKLKDLDISFNSCGSNSSISLWVPDSPQRKK